MKQLGWTSIEQSKKLVEAGLDPNTADMFYVFNTFVQDIAGLDIGKPKETGDIPCWSLGALIGLLPKMIETKKPKNLYFSEILPSNNCVAYTAFGRDKVMVFLKFFATGVESDTTLIDNIVSMICWLLDNGYIKKEN